MTERLQKIMDYAGVSPNKFAAILGIQRSSISHMMSGRNNPSLTVVQKILKSYPDISSDWLLFGEGNMLKAGAASAPATDVTTPEASPLLHSTSDDTEQLSDSKATYTQTPETQRAKNAPAEHPREAAQSREQAAVTSKQPATADTTDTAKHNIEYQTIAASPINTATNVPTTSAQIQTMLANGLIVLDHSTKTFTVYSPGV